MINTTTVLIRIKIKTKLYSYVSGYDLMFVLCWLVVVVVVVIEYVLLLGRQNKNFNYTIK